MSIEYKKDLRLVVTLGPSYNVSCLKSYGYFIILPAKEQSVPCYQEEILSDLLLIQEVQMLLFFLLLSNFGVQLQQENVNKRRVLAIIVG